MSRYLLIERKKSNASDPLMAILKKDGHIIMMDTWRECCNYLKEAMQVGDVYSHFYESTGTATRVFNYEYMMYESAYWELWKKGMHDTPEGRALEQRLDR